VNTVARLEQNAPTGEILIGDSTYRLVKDAVNIERVRPLELKGKAERVVAYLLRGVTAADEGISRRLDVSMVGRQRELKALMDVLGRATEDRKGQLVTVFGSAGVGKTRLLREFVTVAGAQPTTLRGHCLSYGDGITFWPLAEVIRQAAAIAEDDPLELARSKLFGLAGHEVRDAMERVAAVIGLSSENYPLQETFWAVRRLLESLAGERPLVVVVEDIHWAEQTLMDLLAYVAAEATAPIVLVCSARPELLEAHDDWAQEGARVQRLALTPLSEDESRRVIENLLGTTAFDGRIGARVIEAAEGNPLFVEQMLSMLIHDGILSRDDAGGWTLTSNIGAVTAPPSISALLSARLDRLSSSERAVMERGAVIGQSFFRSAVEALASTDVRERLNETLASLVRKELIHDDRSQFAGQKTYRFVHALIRDAAYHGLRKRTRAELHAGFVDWIERTLPDRMMELEEIRGYHLEQAYLILVQLARADEHVVGRGARGAAGRAAAGRRLPLLGWSPCARAGGLASGIRPASTRGRAPAIDGPPTPSLPARGG
jgi:predicted ATPase